MSSDSTGVTVRPGAARETVCSSRPSGPAAGTTNTSAWLAPATLVTRPVRPESPTRTIAVRTPGGVDSGMANVPVAEPSASDRSVCVSPAFSRATVASTALPRNGTGATAAPDLLQNHRGLAGACSRPAQLLGHQQPSQSEFGGERPPHLRKSACASSYRLRMVSGAHRSANSRRTLSRSSSSMSV